MGDEDSKYSDLEKIPSNINEKVERCGRLTDAYEQSLGGLADLSPDIIAEEMKESIWEFSVPDIIEARVKDFTKACLKSK